MNLLHLGHRRSRIPEYTSTATSNPKPPTVPLPFISILTYANVGVLP